MHLLNILLRKKTEVFVILISVLFTYFALLPLLLFGVNAAFFSIDPDVVYFANALSYIKWNIIGYYDHPGIPSIYLISLVLIPVRIYSKFVVNQNFFDFIFNNYQIVIFYSRIFQSSIFLLGLFVYLKSIFNLTKSYLTMIIGILFLACFTPIYYSVLSISAEPLNFLLVSIWIFVFSLSLSNKKNNYISLLLFLSGMLFANRATNIFYMVSSIWLLMHFKKGNFKKIILIPIGFLVGIFPSLHILPDILKRILLFASASGIHGAGENKFFDSNLYLLSFKTFWNRDFVVTTTVLILAFCIFYFRKKINPEVLHLSSLFVIGFLVFAKFPLAHYQVPNLLFVIFSVSIIISKLNIKFTVLIIFILSYFAFVNYRNYFSILSLEMGQVVKLEQFVVNNPSKIGEVWEWARVKNFAYLWTNSWGGGVFKYQIDNLEIPILNFQKNIMDKCWDSLYIQKDSLHILTENYPKNSFVIKNIEGSQGIVLINSKFFESNPCHFKKL